MISGLQGGWLPGHPPLDPRNLFFLYFLFFPRFFEGSGLGAALGLAVPREPALWTLDLTTQLVLEVVVGRVVARARARARPLALA